MKKSHQPPRWARAFLAWYCKPELYEDLVGDLTEYFERNVHSRGLRYARFTFVIDTLKFFRPYTIRKPSFVQLLIHRIMLGSYVKTSARNIVRNKLFSTINVAGLAVSMCVGLILIGLLSDLLKYDRFHQNYDRTYRIISDRGDDNPYASTSMKAALDIRESVAGIEKVGILKRSFSGDFTKEETTVPLEGFWADSEALSVFTFPFIAGDPATALKDPFSIVLTETAAKKLFGNADPIGKVISYKSQSRRYPGPFELTVTGVMHDVPKFSHLRFEMLGSLSSLWKIHPDDKSLTHWDSMWDTYVYFVVPPGANLETLQYNLDEISKAENPHVTTGSIHLSFQPLGSIALGEDLNNSAGPVMGMSDVWMIGVLALIVLLSACFNYTNLSIARALNRAREVGVRKVTGATKGQVVGQFVVESIFIATLSVVVAFGLFVLVKPYFLGIDRHLSEMLTISFSFQLALSFILFAMITGIAAGIVPAFFFSRLNAATVLKNTHSVQPFRNVNLRKTLIVIQYTVSVIFIASTLIGLRQYKHLLSFDLGYKTKDIFNIRLQGNKADIVAKELAALPEVKGISKSTIVTSIGNYWGSKIKYTPDDSTWANYNGIDENYLAMHEHHLISGRNFSVQTDESAETEVIVNMDVLKRFKIADGDPFAAIDEILLVDGKEMKIIGVVENFHYGKVDSKSELVMFRHVKGTPNWLNVHIESSNWQETAVRLERAWRKVDNVHPFDGQFYDDQIRESYNEFSAMLTVIGTLSFLAICISSLGLFGMVVSSTESRLKEVSVRKVMGAGEWRLVYLMSKGFLTLLAIAVLIGLPLTYIFFDQVALPELVNPAPISVLDLFIGIAFLLAVALAMIGSQTLKVARANPAEVLRSE
jgi:putative ABC transport system permease protein